MPCPGPGTARRKQQLASGRVRDFVLLCRCCVVTYVRGPDYKAGLHFSIRAQVGEFQLGLVCVCVGISGGNLSRPPAQLESAVGPLLSRSYRSHLSGETVKGTCVSWRKRILDECTRRKNKRVNPSEVCYNFSALLNVFGIVV